ncbi:MAG: hypothetical protein WC759_00040 [Candidatus Micrarchaeia archaeon]|jgi:hypothetical protein
MEGKNQDCRCRMSDYYCVLPDMHTGEHKCIHQITEEEAKKLGVHGEWLRINSVFRSDGKVSVQAMIQEGGVKEITTDFKKDFKGISRGI